MLRYSFRDFISYMKDWSGKAVSYLSAFDMIGPIPRWHYQRTWAEDEANQVGNAVPVPLVKAVGEEFFRLARSKKRGAA